MNPNRRLDQLEPIVADVAQKTDRLIEGQGLLLEVATRAEQKADQAAAKADLAAKGVADLTIITQQQYKELKAGQEKLQVEVTTIQSTVDIIRTTQETILQYLREKLL